jgi:hypothetical protein
MKGLFDIRCFRCTYDNRNRCRAHILDFYVEYSMMKEYVMKG